MNAYMHTLHTQDIHKVAAKILPPVQRFLLAESRCVQCRWIVTVVK
jgi:hypothetical protein